MRRLLALSLLLACSRRISGPVPTVAGTRSEQDGSGSPAALCNAQGSAQADGWLIDVLGKDFAPLPTGILSDAPGVVMPQVTLSGPETYLVPELRVRFADPTRLVLDMPTADTRADAHHLAPGDYSVAVANLGGGAASAPAAIRVVDPPQIALLQIAPSGGPPGLPRICDPADELVITGAGFRPDALPALSLVSPASGASLPLTVAAVGTGQITASVPPGTFGAVTTTASGASYTAVVVDPAGCFAPSARVPPSFGFTDVKGYDPGSASCVRLGLTATPAFGWSQRNQPITIHAFGATFSGGAPIVTISARLKGATGFTMLPLRSVGFIDANTITAVLPACSGASSIPLADVSTGGCPAGIAPGTYSIDVQDPSGAFDSVPFTVAGNEPPSIASILPSAIDTAGTGDLTILSGGVSGATFPPVGKAQIVFPIAPGSATVRACDLPLLSWSASAIHAQVQSVAQTSCVEFDALGRQRPAGGGFGLSPGLYAIRVQDLSSAFYADFSGLLITSVNAAPASLAAATGSLTSARGSFSMVQAADDTGTRFLYALGGITAPISPTSAAASYLSSIEAGAIDRFGDVSAFQTLARPLTSQRRGLAAFSVQIPGDTGYVFVVGGVDFNHTPMSLVERAQVLRTADAPVLDVQADIGGALAAGSYYYRVSAVLPATDPKNPAGETLASDLQPATVAAGGRVLLSWPCAPGATGYRVYRTAARNQPATSFRQLGPDLSPSVSCAGSPLPRESFIDPGTLALGKAPLLSGALGSWVQMPSLTTPRGDAAARLVGDRVYVVGGCGGSCDSTTLGGELQTYETAQLAGNSLGSFSSGTLVAARRRTALAIASKATAPDRFADASSAWLVVAGGEAAIPLTAANLFEVAQVVSGGSTVSAPSFAAASYTGPTALSGGWAEVAGDLLLAYGSTGAATFAIESHDICNGSPCVASTSFSGALSATAVTPTRYLPGEAFWNGIVFAAGGLSDTSATATALSSIARFAY